MPQTLGIVASHKNNAWWDAWGAAYERALASNRQAHILCVGDSVSQGFYASTPYYVNSWPGRISANLASRTGVTAGTGVLPAHEEFEVTDARTSVTGTWSAFTGGFFSQGRSASSSATFVLGPVTCSAFRITYATESDGGAWTATVDAGTPANYTSNGSTGITTVEIDTGGAGSHTLTITATNKCYLVAVEAISNPTSGVKVSRVARSEQQISALIANADAKSSLRAFRTMTADLVIIEFGLNEAYFGTTTATFEANMRTLIDEAVAIGASVLVVAAPPPNPTHIAEVTWSAFRASMSAISTEKKVGYLDMADYWISYAENSLYFHDNVHPNQGGHADMAQIVADFVVETVAPSTPSTFVPTDIANLAFWLDASDASAFTYSSGAVVSQWNDLSGNVRHMVQATTTNQPTRAGTINGRRVVAFDGLDNYMDAGDTLDLGTNSVSMFAVVKQHDTNTQFIIGKYKNNPSDGEYGMYNSVNVMTTVYDAGTIAIANSGAFTTTVSSILGFIVDRSAGTVTQRINRTTDGTASFTPDTGSSRNTVRALYLGALRATGDASMQAGYYLYGYVAEVLIYTQALDSTERDQVETYLANKWGII